MGIIALQEVCIVSTDGDSFLNFFMQELNMSCCIGLREFPPIEEGAFTQLTILRLDGCESLKTLPAEFTSKGAFPALEVISLECLNMVKLPVLHDWHDSPVFSVTSCKQSSFFSFFLFDFFN